MTPNRIYIGDTLEFGINVPDYPPADGWTLKMRFAPRFTTPTQAAFTLTATTGPVTIDGESFDYAVQATPAATAAWKAGAYGWGSWVEKTGARVTLEGTQYQGETTMLADPSALAQGDDARSQARKALDDLHAWMAALAGAGSSAGSAVLERRIGDRAVKYASPEEARAGIVQMVNFWEQRVNEEEARDRLSKGLPSRSRLQVRF